MAASYAVVTAARNEAENLGRLGEALAAQTLLPEAWAIVENGSTDATPELAAALAERHDWIHVVTMPVDSAVARGGPIVRAFNVGLASLERVPDVVVKLDADISFEPDYFERLLAEFTADPRLGIASGGAWEEEGGEWRERFMTGESAWGAARAYRRECLDDVAPLVERIGWDTVDALAAKVAGWEIRTVADLPFRHHRPEGARDGRAAAFDALGRCAHYLHYRPSYQLVRTLHQLRRDPRAVRLLTGYAAAALAREPRHADARVTGYLREQQRARRLLLRRREVLGRRVSRATG